MNGQKELKMALITVIEWLAEIYENCPEVKTVAGTWDQMLGHCEGRDLDTALAEINAERAGWHKALGEVRHRLDCMIMTTPEPMEIDAEVIALIRQYKADGYDDQAIDVIMNGRMFDAILAAAATSRKSEQGRQQQEEDNCVQLEAKKSPWVLPVTPDGLIIH